VTHDPLLVAHGAAALRNRWDLVEHVTGRHGAGAERQALCVEVAATVLSGLTSAGWVLSRDVDVEDDPPKPAWWWRQKGTVR
jgi:hypothetical protein